MNNLIYKEDAIKVINNEITIEGIVTHYEAMRDAVHQAKKIYNKRLEELPPAELERAIKDCRNCKHGYYNDHWNTYFCYNSNDCSDLDKWEPSAQPEANNEERTMEEFMYGQDLGNPEDGSL